MQVSGKLLDTNFIINSAMGKLKKPEWISLERNIFISEITFGEILYGIEWRIDKVRLSDAKEWLIKLQQVDKKSFSAIHSIRGVV